MTDTTFSLPHQGQCTNLELAIKKHPIVRFVTNMLCVIGSAEVPALTYRTNMVFVFIPGTKVLFAF